jgi:hypothetical protein
MVDRFLKVHGEKGALQYVLPLFLSKSEEMLKQVIRSSIITRVRAIYTGYAHENRRCQCYCRLY